VSGEDVSGGGMSGGATGDEAAWQDLVAHYDMPEDWQNAAVPWPDRENLTTPGHDADGQDPGSHPPGTSTPPGTHARPGFNADRTRVVRPAIPPFAPAPWPPAGRGPGAGPDTDQDDDADEHYVPPPPPPLPHLDSVAKGAWTALFGGPAYLLLATLLGWTVPGWAALAAIAAFVTGFVLIVLRLGDGPSRGSGPDNGAVL
jgi:hypothetical protein